jgi:signal transduction histidine kinase/ActR/RegA family two-component response regulator
MSISREKLPSVLYRISRDEQRPFYFSYLSPNAAELFGIEVAAVLADPQRFACNMAEEDLARGLVLMQHSAETMTPFYLAFSYRVRGGLRWIACQSLPLKECSGAVSWTGQFDDITHQKEAELDLLRSQTLLKAAREQAQLGCWDFELATGKISWSPEVFAIHGLDPSVGEPDFENLAKLYVAEDFAILAAAVERTISLGEPYCYDLRIVRPKTGEIRHISATGGVLRNPMDQSIERLIGTIFDITTRKDMEASLAAARDAAEASALAKSNFLATMSHELRTPLNGILGMAALLQQSLIDSNQKEFCETITHSAEALLSVVNDILDWSRIESGKIQFEAIPFDCAHILNGVCDILRPQAEPKGLEISVISEVEAIPTLVGDPSRLRQVLLNLAANAVKFTEEGFVRLKLSSKAASAEHFGLRIEITDSGIGITPQQISKLFHRFSQADASTTRRFGGSGLGLAISKSLIEQMGGRIGVDSKVGEGSTFWIELELPIHAAPKPEVPKETVVSTDKALNILIAEDNEVNQRLATLVLEMAGHQSEVAADGLIALEKALSQDYDLILMDCQMPGMDGYEATRQIRQQISRHVPIIGLTASALINDRQDCLNAGMDDYLSKPYRANQLLAAVARWANVPSGSSGSCSPSADTHRVSSES